MIFLTQSRTFESSRIVTSFLADLGARVGLPGACGMNTQKYLDFYTIGR